MGYLTVARAWRREELVKGSAFIAFVTPVASVAEALEHLAAVRAEHAEATHNPYAYRVGPEVRFSDDGEPGGTAGRPMLEVLQKRGLDHVLAVVTRYYGGTKLGAGGLVRAYGGSLARALDEAGCAEVRETVSRTVCAPFSDLDAVHRLLNDWPGLVKGEPAYTAAGLKLRVTLFAEDEGALREALTQVTRGAARLA
ncbi:IMPACT family protein [Truepera radiovictrix]|uniref:Impact N-terminal domain-containing protein n=1 Tax=Truepera radiovictrix (strain DSM 17093 / CIP 108686 / LMG 22925 / RQ-24) TaxID=649638 RepID=D7CYC6_TRURR|nr:YigZ family protein [Truepera radiovictrix]ADI14765.1 protein of unknown function UPF0029 [Truepera radiovictrix DSM 17093]WMT56685.1 YigZ family protein [Truepera radiovictrix]